MTTKKIIIGLFAFAAVSFFACQKEQIQAVDALEISTNKGANTIQSAEVSKNEHNSSLSKLSDLILKKDISNPEFSILSKKLGLQEGLTSRSSGKSKVTKFATKEGTITLIELKPGDPANYSFYAFLDTNYVNKSIIMKAVCNAPEASLFIGSYSAPTKPYTYYYYPSFGENKTTKMLGNNVYTIKYKAYSEAKSLYENPSKSSLMADSKDFNLTFAIQNHVELYHGTRDVTPEGIGMTEKTEPITSFDKDNDDNYAIHIVITESKEK